MIVCIYPDRFLALFRAHPREVGVVRALVSPKLAAGLTHLMIFKSSTTLIPEVHAVPRHIAIIMDGNGRWAKKRMLPRIAGHRKGVESVRTIVQACAERGSSN